MTTARFAKDQHCLYSGPKSALLRTVLWKMQNWEGSCGKEAEVPFCEVLSLDLVLGEGVFACNSVGLADG